MVAAAAEAEAARDTEAAAGISEAEARGTGTMCGTEGTVELLNPKGLRLAAVQLSLREGFLPDIRLLGNSRPDCLFFIDITVYICQI